MKCDFCGANIDIESDVCPHCGMQKRQFAQHRRDMGIYQTEFQNVKNTVVEENKRFSKKSAYITVVCGLVILNLLLFAAITMNNEISKAITRSKIKANIDTHLSKMQEFEENGDYEALYYYYAQNSLNYSDDDRIREYRQLYNLGCQYYTFESYISRIFFENQFDKYKEESSIQREIEYLAEVYTYTTDHYGNDETYSNSLTPGADKEQHMNSYHEILDNMDLLLKNYCGFDEETFQEFKQSSKTKQQLMIEEAVALRTADIRNTADENTGNVSINGEANQKEDADEDQE